MDYSPWVDTETGSTSLPFQGLFFALFCFFGFRQVPSVPHLTCQSENLWDPQESAYHHLEGRLSEEEGPSLVCPPLRAWNCEKELSKSPEPWHPWEWSPLGEALAPKDRGCVKVVLQVPVHNFQAVPHLGLS